MGVHAGFIHRFLDTTFLLIQLVLIARFFLSWAAPGRDGRIARRIGVASQPYVAFAPVRKVGSWLSFGFDAAPVVAFVLVTLLRRLIVGT